MDDFGRKQLFMGAGEHSLAYMGYLHSQLERAFTTLSGIQQPPRGCDPECSHTIALDFADRKHERDVEEGEYELEMIAKKICVALTGKKPSFKDVEVVSDESFLQALEELEEEVEEKGGVEAPAKSEPPEIEVVQDDQTKINRGRPLPLFCYYLIILAQFALLLGILIWR